MEKLPLGLALDLRKVVPYKTGSWRTLDAGQYHADTAL